jgi:hypothetical protein
VIGHHLVLHRVIHRRLSTDPGNYRRAGILGFQGLR